MLNAAKFPTEGHLQKLWGGRPRPRPAPWPASSVVQRLAPSTEQRDEGVPHRPGVCPTRHPQNPNTGKTMWHYAESVRYRMVSYRFRALGPMGGEMQAVSAARQSSERSAALPRLPDLAALVRSMAEGHQDALARLYDETSPMVNGLLLRILARPEDAEEVLLDVFMKAWKYAPSYSEKRGSVQGWLLIMARNAAIDRIRQRRAQA